MDEPVRSHVMERDHQLKEAAVSCRHVSTDNHVKSAALCRHSTADDHVESAVSPRHVTAMSANEILVNVAPKMSRYSNTA